MAIPFTCPHCGHQTEVASQYAGQTGPCAGCGRTVTVPSFSGSAAVPAANSSRSVLVVVLVVLLVVVVAAVVIIGGLAALLIPAVGGAREAARRAQCANNLKQIGLALHIYHDTYGSFPPAVVRDEQGRAMHSWRVLILPYLEQNQLYEQYDFTEPWDGPRNRLLHNQVVPIYTCPSNLNNPTETSYLAIVGKSAAFRPEGAIRLRDIRDGASNTLLVVETSGQRVHWMEPRDIDQETVSLKINGDAPETISSEHPGCANVLFVDASVRALPEDTSPEELRAMITRDGGEVPAEDEGY